MIIIYNISFRRVHHTPIHIRHIGPAFGAIQVLHNAGGWWGVNFFGKKAFRRCKVKRY